MQLVNVMFGLHNVSYQTGTSAWRARSAHTYRGIGGVGEREIALLNRGSLIDSMHLDE